MFKDIPWNNVPKEKQKQLKCYINTRNWSKPEYFSTKEYYAVVKKNGVNINILTRKNVQDIYVKWKN